MIDPTSPDFLNTPAFSDRPKYAYVPFADYPPILSIITPFYNTGDLFHEMAKSIFQQSFQQWEWLIIDDGSTDPNSIDILNQYRSCDSRIKVINHKINRGVSAARNTGFSQAKTDYIVQVDSDDLLEHTAIEKWLWFLISNSEYSIVNGFSVGFGAKTYLWSKGFGANTKFLDENLVTPASMIRKSAFHDADGYDEDIREGLEDWDFWLRCANASHWGYTIPEYLQWYRRRKAHNDRWRNWDKGEKQKKFQAQLCKKYPKLWKDKFPEIHIPYHMPYDNVPDQLPCENKLQKKKSRLLMVLPWMRLGGADKFNLDLINELRHREWEITIATTLQGDNSWYPVFSRYTPDIFILNHYLRLIDYPRFLRYLIESRQIDVVMISNSELGYQLLPYLRSHFPTVTFIDYNHIEEEYWKNGGHPRMAVEASEMIDLHIVASKHLKQWMIKRGVDENRIHVCYINVNTDGYKPNDAQHSKVRKKFDLDNEFPIIAFAGRLVEQKQPRVLAYTLLRLYEKGLKFGSIIAGDGPEMDWLKTFIHEHKLDNVMKLVGAISPNEVKKLMQGADIFFLPSQWEGIALSIYEAMACGLPIIGADVGGQSELVTPACGVLISNGREEYEINQYFELLGTLINNPAKRTAMGNKSRERIVDSFRIEIMGDRFIYLLNKALQLNHSKPRPKISPRLGKFCAIQAIEHTRLSNWANQVWQQGELNKQQNVEILAPSSPLWNLSAKPLIYLTIRRLLFRFFANIMEKNIYYVNYIKERTKRLLLEHRK